MTTPTRRDGDSRRISTGTTMLPTVMPSPITSVPATAVPYDAELRTTEPTMTAARQVTTAASAPVRRTTSRATGANSPKQSTGRLVSSPIAPPPTPRSVRSSAAIGATATNGERRLTATSTSATTNAHGSPARTRVPARL